MKFRILILLIGVCLFSTSLYAQKNRSYKIIVNESNTISSIDTKKLSKIFLKKVTLWEDKTKILPVDLIPKSKTREAFSENIHGKSVDAIKAYWQKQIFSGRGVPPPEKKSDKDVIAYVKNNEGAIGYISTNTKVSDVNVVEISE